MATINEQPDHFGPPEIPNLASLTDGRSEAQFDSAYPWRAWIQIILELFYLLLVLALASTALIWISVLFSEGKPLSLIDGYLGVFPQNRKVLLSIVVALSGACGGCAASLKWLYHSVAKKRWHRDRLVWRVVVPILSAVLSVFTGLMINSGLIPLITEKPLTAPTICAGFGFFVGLFSDNLLASLNRLAFRVFGTVDRQGGVSSIAAEESAEQRGRE